MRITGYMLVGSLLLLGCDSKSSPAAGDAGAAVEAVDGVAAPGAKGAKGASDVVKAVYSPSGLRTALIADGARSGPLWGKTVTVKGVALSSAIPTNDASDAGIDKFVSLELADTSGEGGLGDIECRFEGDQPGVKKGATVTVTGTPDKDAVLILLKNCVVK